MTKNDFFSQIDDSWCHKMGVSVVKQSPPSLFGQNEKQKNRTKETSIFFPSKPGSYPFRVCFLDFDTVNSVEKYIHDMEEVNKAINEKCKELAGE